MLFGKVPDRTTRSSTRESHMKLSARMHGRHANQTKSQQHLMCPVCGQTGYAAAEEDTAVAFTVQGEDRGQLVWKCFVCGSGFVVKGANTKAIPADRWAVIQARYERSSARV
jgi:rubrerythrin